MTIPSHPGRPDVPAAVARSELAACLVAADRDQVLRAAAQLAEGLKVIALQPAESGLALMQWRDAVKHQPFYLGEIPMARAAVALIDHRGARAEGGAVVAADDVELARALALLDAVFAHRWPGAEVVDALAAGGAGARARVRAERQAILWRTRVDFSLLAQADDEEDEDGGAAA